MNKTIRIKNNHRIHPAYLKNMKYILLMTWIILFNNHNGKASQKMIVPKIQLKINPQMSKIQRKLIHRSQNV